MGRFLAALLIAVVLTFPLRGMAAEGPRDTTVAEVLALVMGNYAHPERINPPEMLEGALSRAAREIPSFRYTLDDDGRSLHLVAGASRATFGLPPPGAREGLRRILEEITVFLGESLTDDPPAHTPAHLLLMGLLSKLDPYAALLDAATYRRFQLRASGRSGDVGLSMARREGVWSVTGLVTGGPGQRAGLREGDRVVQIDNHPVGPLDADEADALLLGVPGSELSMVLMREGRRPVPMVLRRVPTLRTSVESLGLFQGSRGQLAYLRVLSFQEDTEEALWDHLGRFQTASQPLIGIILDLRGNPGGVVDQAIRIADLFLARGEIATLTQAGQPQRTVEARGYRGIPHQPMVVLINQDTASAGELVAGALQANRRALVIGERSYGKAAVQSVFPLSEGGGLKLTVATFRTRVGPFGEGMGLVPHVRLRSVIRVGNIGKDLVDGAAKGGSGWRGLIPMEPEEGAPLSRLGFPVQAELPFLNREGGRVASWTALPQTGSRAQRLRRIEEDYAVGLARRLLFANHPADQQALLRQAVMSQGEERVRQDHVLVGELAADGVDWSPSKGLLSGEAAFGKLKIEARSGRDGAWRPIREGLSAGESLRLDLSVHNKGSTPLHRLAIQVAGPLGVFDGLELPLGLVSPGAPARIEVTRKLPGRMPEGSERIELALRDADGRVYDRISLHIPLRVNIPAGLRLTVAGAEGSGAANLGSGPMPRSLRLKLENRGEETEASAWLSPAAPGVKLDGRAQPLPPVALEAGREAWLRFQVGGVRPGQAPPLWLNLLVQRLSGAQTYWRTSLARLQAGNSLVLQPPLIQWRTVPGVDGEGRLVLRGDAQDGQGLRDVMVFLNGRKVLYVPARNNPGFVAEFHLNEPALQGRNLVRVQARDLDGLVSERIYAVWHDAPGSDSPSDPQSR